MESNNINEILITQLPCKLVFVLLFVMTSITIFLYYLSYIKSEDVSNDVIEIKKPYPQSVNIVANYFSTSVLKSNSLCCYSPVLDKTILINCDIINNDVSDNIDSILINKTPNKISEIIGSDAISNPKNVSLCWGNNEFVYTNGLKLFTSPDGIIWKLESIANTIYTNITYAPNLECYVAIGMKQNTHFTYFSYFTKDKKVWTIFNTSGDVKDIVYSSQRNLLFIITTATIDVPRALDKSPVTIYTTLSTTTNTCGCPGQDNELFVYSNSNYIYYNKPNSFFFDTHLSTFANYFPYISHSYGPTDVTWLNGLKQYVMVGNQKYGFSKDGIKWDIIPVKETEYISCHDINRNGVITRDSNGWLEFIKTN